MMAEAGFEPSKFVLSDERRKRVPASEPTLWRQEKAGKFPRRIKIGARKVAHFRSEIELWEQDPSGWAALHARAVALVAERDDGQFEVAGDQSLGPFPTRRFAESIAIKVVANAL